MIRFAFHPSKLARKKIEELKKNGQSTSLSDIFRPKALIKTRGNSYKLFKHQEAVLDLMQVIDGSKQDDEVLGFLDYEKLKKVRCAVILFVFYHLEPHVMLWNI